MLRAIRGQIGSWIVKILFVFLIASFAVWGIGDVFRGRGPSQTVAEVGDVEISVGAVDRAFRQNVERMRQLFGPDFGVEQAASLGLLDQALGQLVTGALLDQEAATLGLLPSDELVAEQVRSQPAFQDDTGRFSRDLFLRVLAANGLNEEGYVDLLRRDLARQQVADAVGIGATVPPTLARALYRHRNETRTAVAIGLTPNLVRNLPEATPDALREFYDAHQDRFTAPEYRALTVVTISPDDLAGEITIPEQRLRAAYDERADGYRQPERRSFDQVVVPDEQAAARIAEAAQAGGTLAEAVAAAEGVDAEVIPLDWSTRDDMLPALADAGFALQDDGISAPVQSPFGWHVLALTGIRPATTPTFEDVRADLEAELKHDQALDRVFEVANALEDALAGGTDLREAAAGLGLPAVDTPPLARDGSARGDVSVPEIPGRDAILETAYTLPQGRTSGLEDTPAGLYYVVQVDEVVAPEVLPFDQVRDRVAEAWTAEKRTEALNAMAENVADRLRAGADPMAVAAELGAEAAETPALLRDGSNRGNVPSALVPRLFEMQVSDVAVVPANGGQIVARLSAVTPADPAAAEDAIAGLSRQLEQGVAQDLLGQFTEALRGRYGVEINRSALQQILGQEPA